MIAREAVLGDPEVLELLRTRFVPLAVDNVANPDLTPAEKEFLTGFDSGIKASTLGFSAFTEGGQKLGSAYDFRPAPIRDMLKKAIREFRPESGGAIVKGDPLEASVPSGSNHRVKAL